MKLIPHCVRSFLDARMKNQRGAVLLLTAFAMPAKIAGLGLSADVGHVYLEKSRLQNAADAAALAGAYQMAVSDRDNPKNPGKWEADGKTQAKAMVAENEGEAIAKSSDYGAKASARTVDAVVKKDVSLTFLPIFSDKMKTMEVNASAKAQYHVDRGIWRRAITFRDYCTIASSYDDIDLEGSIAAVGQISKEYQNLAQTTYTMRNSEGKNELKLWNTSTNGYETMPVFHYDDQYLYSQEMHDFVVQKRAERAEKAKSDAGYEYIPDKMNDPELYASEKKVTDPLTGKSCHKEELSQIDLSQYDGKIVEFSYFSNKLYLSQPLTKRTYVILDGGDSTVFDVSNENSNGNLVILYVPTDANLEKYTNTDTYDAESYEDIQDKDYKKAVKKQVAHMAKSQISFINEDPSGKAHTFSGLIYAPFGRVTFEAPGKANDTAKGFTQKSSGLINFNGSIVADRVQLRGETRGYFTYNETYADIMPAAYDKRKPNISTRLLKD